MTDKTPQDKTENPVNTPTALAKTTDTAREGELKSRTLPQADALKDRFKAGSIPLQTDFADLIDLANMGRQAMGGAKGQTGPANGFTLSSEGRLELKPNAAKGISVEQDGIAVKVNTNNGLKVTSAGIAINDGLGLEFSSTGQLNLKVKKNGGFSGGPGGACVIPGEGVTVSNSGVGVKAGNGIAVTSSGVNIKLAKGIQTNGGGGQGKDGTTLGSAGGLNVNQNGFSVAPGDGMQINTRGVSIKLAANSGLSADETNGLKIVPEQMFQKGMVIMFAGTEAEMPKGWALCDGNGGRPDLRDRFVLGSTGFANVNQTNGKIVTGTNVDKQYMVSSDARTPGVSVTVNNHTLTISQIPSHSHYDGVRYYCDNDDIININEYGLYDLGRRGFSSRDYDCVRVNNFSFVTKHNLRLVKSSNTGDSGGHNHTTSATQSSHQHNTNVVPPYYILAFIIKV